MYSIDYTTARPQSPSLPLSHSSAPRFYIETYGCQMNVSDSEVVTRILLDAGYAPTDDMEAADVLLINTCSIRDNAEQRIWGRLDVFRLQKRQRAGVLVGVLGCMAGRLKEQLLEHRAVDMVAGPDAYRSLPQLLREAAGGQKGINTQLSRDETYADISPVRTDPNGITAFVSIMRGCNNMCAYCVVPYTRGAERSRPAHTIVREVRELFENGYRDVTLLGQNVNSYHWSNPEHPADTVNFAQLLELVALVNPLLRVRFATSHPKDMSNGVLYTMAMYPNICNHIHLPVQSGSSRMLEKMNRRYTRDEYLERIAKIREVLPDCAISTDIIAGFCTELDYDHAQTLSLMEEANFDQAYLFQYSERPDTKAARHFPDDVPEKVKSVRLHEIIALQRKLSLASNHNDVGKTFEVLVESYSKRSDKDLCGRTPHNKMVIFPRGDHRPGDYVEVTVTRCSPATLFGTTEL